MLFHFVCREAAGMQVNVLQCLWCLRDKYTSAQNIRNSEGEKFWLRGFTEDWPVASSEFNSGAGGGK